MLRPKSRFDFRHNNELIYVGNRGRFPFNPNRPQRNPSCRNTSRFPFNRNRPGMNPSNPSRFHSFQVLTNKSVVQKSVTIPSIQASPLCKHRAQRGIRHGPPETPIAHRLLRRPQRLSCGLISGRYSHTLPPRFEFRSQKSLSTRRNYRRRPSIGKYNRRCQRWLIDRSNLP